MAALAAMVWASTAAAQAPARRPRRRRPRRRIAKQVQNIPLELQVVIARYQGDKRVSSLPYVLSLKSSIESTDFAPGQGASLRLGSRVPIRTQVVTPAADGKPATTSQLGQLRERRHEHRCAAPRRSRMAVSKSRSRINESSVIVTRAAAGSQGSAGMGDYPVFRSYQSTNTLFVKEGQTTQFTAASDRVSGEVVRVEVKLTVVK